MSESITLYADKLWESPYVFSVYVALREKGLAFATRELDLDRGDQRSTDYAARSLTSRVPCIDHAGFVVSESLAILEYLDETFAAPAYPRLLPENVQARARARQILGWLRSDLLPLRDERPTTTIFFTPSKAALSSKAQASVDKLLHAAEQVIPKGEGDLFGAWSIADADLGLMLHRLICNGDPLPERVKRYAQRQWQRPSVREFVALKRPPLS